MSLLALGLIGGASRCVADVKRAPISGDPPARATLLVGALGRREVAGDVVWLQFLQLLGTDAYTRARYPRLEDWVALTTELHPRLLGPFYFGVTLLLGDPQRRDVVDAMIARAEERVPDDFRFPLERGVVAYFGRFDALAAAEHFERAATKPNAPPFVGRLAATVRKRGVMCATIADDAARVAQGPAALEDRTVECVKRRIEAAVVAARLNQDPIESIDDLITHGHLPADALLPGICWNLTYGTATAKPCPPEQ